MNYCEKGVTPESRYQELRGQVLNTEALRLEFIMLYHFKKLCDAEPVLSGQKKLPTEDILNILNDKEYHCPLCGQYFPDLTGDQICEICQKSMEEKSERI